MNATEVLVDARNVLRSRWPNVPELELVDRTRRWAEAAGVRATIVFDGRAPDEAPDVVGTLGESADEWIARRAAELRAAGRTFWLVTSDRALRGDAGRGAERIVGGGAFLRELGLA
jgi:predicted RNA-binding protein with PIN domain